MLQNVIQRMAENSRHCKLWCITLVAATLVLVARTGEPQHALIAIVPTVLFLVLDSYYLALEQAFRRAYVEFVTKLHNRTLDPPDLYVIAPIGSIPKQMFVSLRSFSIWPFYGLAIATILLGWLFIFDDKTPSTIGD